MTNEELARHWGVPLQEAKSIADYMNAHYYLTVGQHRETKLWYGLMFEMTDKEDALPREAYRTPKGFESKLDAIHYLNEQMDSMIMPKVRAEKWLNVPQDAYKALIKIPEPVRTAERHIVSIWRDKEHTKD